MKKDLSRSPSLTHALCTCKVLFLRRWWRIITKNGILFSRRRQHQQQQRQRRNVRLFVVVVVAAVLLLLLLVLLLLLLLLLLVERELLGKVQLDPTANTFRRWRALYTLGGSLLYSPLSNQNGCGAQKTLNSIKSNIHTYVHITWLMWSHTLYACVEVYYQTDFAKIFREHC